VISLLVTGFVGVSLLDASATQQEVAAQQAREAVQPGEDPDHGPAGMRKAGADLAVSAGDAFSILLVVVLPPVQVLAVLIPVVIPAVMSAISRKIRSPDSRSTEEAVSAK
jgi:hypothetical protein